MTNPFSIGVTATKWGTTNDAGERNDCYWNIAKNQLGEGATAQEISALTEELIALNNERAGKAGQRDTLVETGQQVFIPLEYAMDEIQTSLNDATTQLTEARGKLTEATTTLTGATTTVQEKLGKLQTAQGALNGLDEENATQEEIQDLMNAYQTALNEYQTALQEQKTAQNAVDEVQNEITTLTENIQNFKAEYEELKSEYDEAEEDLQAQIDELDSQMAELDNSITETEGELNSAKAAQEAAEANESQAAEIGINKQEDGTYSAEGEIDREILLLADTGLTEAEDAAATVNAGNEEGGSSPVNTDYKEDDATATGTGVGDEESAEQPEAPVYLTTYMETQITQEQLNELKNGAITLEDGRTLVLDSDGQLVTKENISLNNGGTAYKTIKVEQPNGGYIEYEYDGDGNVTVETQYNRDNSYTKTFDEYEEEFGVTRRVHCSNNYDSSGVLTSGTREKYNPALSTPLTLSGNNTESKETLFEKQEFTRTAGQNGQYTETTVTTNSVNYTTTEVKVYDRNGNLLSNQGAVDKYVTNYNSASDKDKQTIVANILSDSSLTNSDLIELAGSIDLSKGTDGKNSNSSTNKDFVSAIQTTLASFDNPEDAKAFLDAYESMAQTSYVNTLQTSQKNGTETQALKDYFHTLESKINNLDSVKQTSVPGSMANANFTTILDSYNSGDITPEQALALLYGKYSGGIDYMMNALHGGAFNLSDSNEEKYAALLEHVFRDAM